MTSGSPFYTHCYNVLKAAPLFAELDAQTLQEMLGLFRRETWPKHAMVMEPARIAQQFCVVVAGRTKVIRSNPHTGREITLFLLEPGDGFDMITLLDGEPHETVAVALDNLEVVAAPIDVVRSWIDRHPAFNRAFLPYLGHQMRTLMELAADVSLHDTELRFCKLILSHVDPGASEGRLRLIHDLSHEELAHMIGSVRVVLNRHIQHLKQAGILVTHRSHIVVTNLQRLVEVYEKKLGIKKATDVHQKTKGLKP